MLLFGVVSYKVRPPRLVSYACLYTTGEKLSFPSKYSNGHVACSFDHPDGKLSTKIQKASTQS